MAGALWLPNAVKPAVNAASGRAVRLLVLQGHLLFFQGELP